MIKMQHYFLGLPSCLPRKMWIIQPEYLYDSVGKISPVNCSLSKIAANQSKQKKMEN
jgi:hypothetical protein